MFSSSVSYTEISHLLNFVENSECRFERNGTTYTSPEAREHIEMKYRHIRDRVQTAEDFIEYAASKSSMSGTKYSVTCDGLTQSSASWLLQELNGYRTGKVD